MRGVLYSGMMMYLTPEQTSLRPKIVLIGAGDFALLAYEYFMYDSPYEVAAFSVEERFITESRLCGLPVVPFETLETLYPPSAYQAFVAITYTNMNRLRTRFVREARLKGYQLVTYISSRAFVWRNVHLGDNCFILEHNVVQPFVTLGNNVILWSGNHIGHRTMVRDNVYFSSHGVVSGYCDIGENCFMGVNATLNDGIVVAPDCLIASGALVVNNTEPGKVYKGSPAKPDEVGALEYFKVNSEP